MGWGGAVCVCGRVPSLFQKKEKPSVRPPYAVWCGVCVCVRERRGRREGEREREGGKEGRSPKPSVLVLHCDGMENQPPPAQRPKVKRLPRATGPICSPRQRTEDVSATSPSPPNPRLLRRRRR